jgi:hypothetical protein
MECGLLETALIRALVARTGHPEEGVMTGQAHWITLIPILLGGISLAVLLWLDSREEHTFHLEERILFCPLQRRNVHATLVRDVASLKVLGVRRCSGSSDPEMVTCDKPCLGSCRASPELRAVRAAA